MTGKEGGRYKWLALLTVSVGTFMATLDASIVNISLPRLTQVFDTEPSVILWVTVTYLLVSVGLLLSLGRLGDSLGRKRVYIVGLALFTVGLALCSISQSIVQLILARVVQAVGAAMIVSLTNAIVTEAFPEEERGKALGLLGGVVSTGLLSGPVLGGLLLDTLDWQAIFYIRVPVGIIGLAMAWRLLREQRHDSGGRAFDWGGAASLFGGLSCLLLFFNIGGREGFTSAPAIGLGTSAAILLVTFILLERRVPHPIVNLRLFRNRAFASALGSMGVMFLASSANTFLTPFYLIRGLSWPATQAGLLFATISGTALVVGPVSGWLSDKVGSRVLCTVGLALISASLFLISRLGPQSGMVDILGRLVILGLGLGMFSSPNNSTVMGSVTGDSLSTGSAMIATVRQIGISSGIAISGTVFAARQLAYSAQLAGGTGASALEQLSLISAFQDTLTYAAAFCAIGIVVSWMRGGRLQPGSPASR